MAENIDAKIAGNPGLEKAGYVRAAAAKIIRAAKPEKMSFKAQLMRIDCRNVVLKIELQMQAGGDMENAVLFLMILLLSLTEFLIVFLLKRKVKKLLRE
ncbi:hypothetical protein [Treponema succinifaciens]|uniref:hypothetical protein n=1 Tax=Treponema succinifaciens TaxID=167 RepID=UPI003FEE6D97